MPLAIELAAARGASLGPAGLRAALADPLRLVSGRRGGDERHRSLRAVLAWSHGLLDADEQLLFRRLGVFAGGFDLTAAARVAGFDDHAETADLVGRLVDKSLVVHERDTGRWRLLGTVRAFARESLDTDDARAEVFDRYLDWARSVAVALVGRLGDQWRPDFDAVAADLRAALLNRTPAQGPAAHELARALGRLAFARRFLTDALHYYQQAAELAPDPDESARDLWSAAHCALIGTAPGRLMVDLLLAAAERAASGDIRAVALARVVEVVNRFDGRISSDLPAEHLRTLLDKARAAGNTDNPSVAAAIAIAQAWNGTGRRYDPHHELVGPAAEAAQATATPLLESAGLDLLGTVAAGVGDLPQLRRTSQKRLELLPLLDRNDPDAALEIEDIFHTAATTALRTGNLPVALDVARQIANDDLLGQRSPSAVGTLVPALMLLGKHTEALQHADALWDSWQRAGRPPNGQVMSAAAFAMLGHGLQDNHDQSTRWRERVHEIADDAGIDLSRLASVVFAETRLAIHQGTTTTKAAELAERASSDLPAYRFDAYAAAAGAELAVVANLPNAATHLTTATRTTTGNAWAEACLTRARARLTNDTTALTEAVAAWTRIGAQYEQAYTRTLLAAPPHHG